MHVDLDAFFAAAEEREHPEFRGKPVVVGADPKNGEGRGVVSTANYAAREFGIRSAMPISRAWRLCPDAVYVRPNFSLYSKVSQSIMKILRRYADKFEVVGLDEAFLDVSNKVKDFEEARELADEIKKKVHEKEKIACSVGVGPNKLVAKIASNYKKPFGTTVVKPEEVKKFLSRLPVKNLIGVGPKTELKLKEFGVKTIGDLSKIPVEILKENFGVWGLRLHQLSNGIDDSEVGEFDETKSIGRETTFEQDTNDVVLISQAIEELVEETHADLTANKVYFKTVTVKIRYENFETHTHAESLVSPTNNKKVISSLTRKLLSPFLPTDRKIRLIGVRVSNLVKAKEYRQKTLKEIIS